MADQKPRDFTDLPDELADWVTEVCEHFEASLWAGRPSRAEDHLSGADGPAREVLLRELLTSECEFRLTRGEEVRPEELEARFPSLGALIPGILDVARRNAAARPDGPAGAATGGWP